MISAGLASGLALTRVFQQPPASSPVRVGPRARVAKAKPRRVEREAGSIWEKPPAENDPFNSHPSNPRRNSRFFKGKSGGLGCLLFRVLAR